MSQSENIQTMLEAPKREIGWDVIIISTGTEGQEEFWQTHLTNLKGKLIKQSTRIITICEDWPGGAGNGLGSLYAYLKALEKGKKLFNIDLDDLQKKGGTIAIYHTAGKGQRLFPLAGSEYCNKPSVKLPEFVTPSEYLTVLDGVIRQTSPYAQSRSGRLSVFWGDQLFIPSKPFTYAPKHHVDILVQLKPLPSEKEWEEQGLNKYGLIAVGKIDEAQHIDKSEYREIKKLIDSQQIDISKGVGLSMGSFSLSYEMTQGLLELFKSELKQKSVKMDSDPYMWMPLTLPEGIYIPLMVQKDVNEEIAKSHYKRIQEFKSDLLKKAPSLGLFGALDIGAESYWWDYGTIGSYYENMLKLTKNSSESVAMRQFFKLNLDKNNNCVLNSFAKAASIKNSVIIGSAADSVTGNHCVIINSVLGDFKGENTLIYNVLEDSVIQIPSGTVRADLRFKGIKTSLKTTLERDGKADWKVKLPGNSVTYEEIHSYFSAL